VSKRLRVILGGQTIADTTRGFRVLETSHPPVYYLPPEDIVAGALAPSSRSSFCEWKGRARYWHVRGGANSEARDAAWSYPTPDPAFAAIRDHVAFYASAMDACFVDEDRVTPQPGGFYGGWITPDIVGPFKGAPGSWGW
jgi:uncharacterized protein (DUF427 family)